jgi:hypothetical protein
LTSDFIDWQNKFEGNEMDYIINNKYYPQYLWWSKKGPCIYRYVGWDIMKFQKW